MNEKEYFENLKVYKYLLDSRFIDLTEYVERVRYIQNVYNTISPCSEIPLPILSHLDDVYRYTIEFNRSSGCGTYKLLLKN